MTQQRRTTQSPEQKKSTRSHAARHPQARGPVAEAAADTARLQRVADHAGSATAGDVMSLQAHYGNRAVQRLLATHQVQAKLAVGSAHDRYEQEADRMAERVMSAPAPGRAGDAAPVTTGAVQAMPRAAGLSPLEAQRMADEEELPASTSSASTSGPANSAPLSEPPTLAQAPAETTTMAASTTTAPALPMPEEEGLQAKFDDATGTRDAEAGPRVEQQLAATQGQGAPLPDSLRAKMETGIGAGFGSVRIHTGGDSVQLNRSLQAQAFTHGSDIYMDAGKYNPSSSDGQRLLAHELTHVVQQGAAGPAVQRRLAVSPAGDAAELEADQLAGQVLRQPSDEEEEKPA